MRPLFVLAAGLLPAAAWAQPALPSSSAAPAKVPPAPPRPPTAPVSSGPGATSGPDASTTVPVLPSSAAAAGAPPAGMVAEGDPQDALTLADAVTTALKQSPQAVASRETARAAAARVGQARSQWLPQVNGSVQARTDYSYQTGVSDEKAAVGTFRYSSQLQVNQLIYDFGRTGGRIAGAKASARAAVGDADATRAQIALGATTTFFAVLQAEALSAVAQKNLDQQKQRLVQAESFFRIGTKPEIDVLIAKTAVAQADLQLVQSRNNILVARTQLLQALGIPDADWPGWLGRPLAVPPQQTVPSTPLEAQPAEVAVNQALPDVLRRRPEYDALKNRVDQAEQAVRTARGDYFPTLSLGGAFTVGGSVGGLTVGSVGGTSRLDVPTAGQPGYGAAGFLNLTWPLFSGTQTIYLVREAEANLRAAQANLEVLRQQVRSQLQQALFQVENARESVLAAQTLEAQAEKQLAQASGRYKAGVGNAIELGDAQVSATSARAQRVQAEYTLATARATLQWHLGVLVERTAARADKGAADEGKRE